MNTEATDRQAEESNDAPARTFRPLADIVETGEAVHVVLEMPGVCAENVDIEFENRVLNVRGRSGKPRSDQYELVHAEYAEGNYERAFNLGADFDPDSIEAKMQNGVLTLILPRSESASPRRIQVQTG